jgi:hypothetical protein
LKPFIDFRDLQPTQYCVFIRFWPATSAPFLPVTLTVTALPDKNHKAQEAEH